MTNRQTGRTTQQMIYALKNAIFVWVNGDLDYPKRLAVHYGRTDMQIIRPSDLSDHHIVHKLRGSEVVVDHAAQLSFHELEGLAKLQEKLSRGVK